MPMITSSVPMSLNQIPLPAPWLEIQWFPSRLHANASPYSKDVDGMFAICEAVGGTYVIVNNSPVGQRHWRLAGGESQSKF